MGIEIKDVPTENAGSAISSALKVFAEEYLSLPYVGFVVCGFKGDFWGGKARAVERKIWDGNLRGIKVRTGSVWTFRTVRPGRDGDFVADMRRGADRAMERHGADVAVVGDMSKGGHLWFVVRNGGDTLYMGHSEHAAYDVGGEGFENRFRDALRICAEEVLRVRSAAEAEKRKPSMEAGQSWPGEADPASAGRAGEACARAAPGQSLGDGGRGIG